VREESAGSVATPPVSGALPNTVAPSRNCTLPVAAPGETFAVKVTGCPNFDGFDEELTLVVEITLATVCVNTAEVLAARLLSPL
jgi:hypothetical protein